MVVSRIVTIHIYYNNAITGENLYSKISLVDLAGSECLATDNETGERVTELLHVMQSLSAWVVSLLQLNVYKWHTSHLSLICWNLRTFCLEVCGFFNYLLQNFKFVRLDIELLFGFYSSTEKKWVSKFCCQMVWHVLILSMTECKLEAYSYSPLHRGDYLKS